MIVDTSALVAVALQEPSTLEILQALGRGPNRRISAANLFEYWIVVGRRVDHETLNAIIKKFDLTVEPVTAVQVEIARSAYERFGKGSGHGARLNFGDCFAYALAKYYDEPLLFVGDDFVRTDITLALPAER